MTFNAGVELFGKSWWGKMSFVLIAFHRLDKIWHLNPSQPFEIEDVVDNIRSESQTTLKTHKTWCGNAESCWAELKVGGAAAPPTV